MKLELDAKLCQDFPRLFAGRGDSMKTTCMCWGFECGDGWEPIIRAAAEKLEPLIVVEIKKHPDYWDLGYFRATQVKEKYGTLRFYLSGGTDEMDTIVDKAECQSSVTCEKCGKTGKLRGRGWLYTACSRHTQKEDRRSK